MLLFDRFPGKARPKDECLATNNNTRLKFIPSSSAVHSIVHESCRNSNQPTFISKFSELTSYSSLLLKKESKIKMTKAIEWYEDFFWNFTSLTVSASSFPLFKDLKKNYYLNSMINKISDVQPSLSVSPWVLIHRRQNFTKLGVKKRYISIISN